MRTLYGSELCEPYSYYYMVVNLFYYYMVVNYANLIYILLYGSELCEPYLYYYMVVNYANLIYTTIW